MRILAIYCGAFSGAILLAQYLLPRSCLLPGAFLLLALTLCLRLRVGGDWGLRIVLVGAGAALGLGWNWLWVRQVVEPARAMVGAEENAVMTVLEYPRDTAYGSRVTVKVRGVPGKAVFYCNDTLVVSPGQTLTCRVQFRDASRIREDSVTTFTSRGAFLLLYSRGETTVEEGSVRSLRWLPLRFGKTVQEKIQALFPGNEGAFLSALLTGDRSDLSPGVSADITEAGLSHILAVSGMHCGFLFLLIQILTGNQRYWTAAVSFPVLLFYAAMTGASPSVVRACIMMSFFITAPLFWRRADGYTSLFAALFLILLYNPFTVASVSLQLSFTAMLGLISVSPEIDRLLLGETMPWIRSGVAAMVSASIGALVFTAPLSAYYFGALSLISPLSSLLCLPVVEICFLLGLIVVGLSFVAPAFCAVPGFLLGLLVQYVLKCAHILGKLPFHAAYFANPYLKYWLLYAYLLFAAARFLKKPSARRYGFAAVLAVVTLIATILLGFARYRGPMDAVVLDVGQGESVLLSSRGRFALVDCGSGNSWYNPGATAAAQLRSMGGQRLDLLIMTHYDSDHVNGLENLLCRIDVNELLLPEDVDEEEAQERVLAIAESYGTSVHFLTEREDRTFGESTLTVLPPLGGGGDNERGLSVLGTAGEMDLLITGDMDGKTERKLLDTYALPDLEALVAGHHGSKYSTSNDLLSALKPEIVCISVGSNSYGHPAPETLARLRAYGCSVYRTDRDGSIHIALNEKNRR